MQVGVDGCVRCRRCSGCDELRPGCSCTVTVRSSGFTVTGGRLCRNTRRAGSCLGNLTTNVGQRSKARGTTTLMISFFVCGAQSRGNTCRLRLQCGRGSAVCGTSHRGSTHPYMLRRYKSFGISDSQPNGSQRSVISENSLKTLQTMVCFLTVSTVTTPTCEFGVGGSRWESLTNQNLMSPTLTR